MKKRRRPPRDAAVFPSAPTLVISPSKYRGAKLSLQTGGSANYHSVGMHLLILYAAACGSHLALREKADEARGVDADYEQEPRRIDGINFQPPLDTRRDDGRKWRLKHVECGRRASPLP
jgi:hypothetical protein